MWMGYFWRSDEFNKKYGGIVATVDGKMVEYSFVTRGSEPYEAFSEDAVLVLVSEGAVCDMVKEVKKDPAQSLWQSRDDFGNCRGEKFWTFQEFQQLGVETS